MISGSDDVGDILLLEDVVDNKHNVETGYVSDDETLKL